MWYLEFLSFTLSQFTLATSMLPWAIMLKEYTIEPDCMLSEHFQFKPWGTACGYTWGEMAKIHTNGKYFAYVNVMMNTRVLMLIAASIAQVMIVSIIFIGTRRDILTLGGLSTGVLCVVLASDYSNEMDTTMTLPNRYLMSRGPGYLLQLICASFGGAIFFLEFYINYYRKSFDDKVNGRERCLKIWAYLISSLSIVSAFGDLVKVNKCPDMVSVFDKNQCPYCNSPLFPMVTTFSLINVFSAFCLYHMLAFYKLVEWRRVINGTCFLTIVSDVAIIAGSMALENADKPGWAIYTSSIGILVGLIFLGVYNQLIPCVIFKE